MLRGLHSTPARDSAVSCEANKTLSHAQAVRLPAWDLPCPIMKLNDWPMRLQCGKYCESLASDTIGERRLRPVAGA